MGNSSSLSISTASHAVVGPQSFNVSAKPKEEKKFAGEPVVTLFDEADAKVEVERGNVSEDGTTTKYTWNPAAPGKYTIKANCDYEDGGNESAKHTVTIYATQEDLQAAKEEFARKRKEEAAKKEAQEKAEKEAKEKKKAEEFEKASPFHLEPALRSVDDLDAGMVVQIVGKPVDGKISVKIDGGCYVLTVSSLEADKSGVEAIQNKLDAFPKFGSEDLRRPGEPFPANLSVQEMMKGACKMLDVTSVKQLLARGYPDLNKADTWGDTPLSVVANTCDPAKDPAEWRTHFGVSYNWQSGDFHTMRQGRESDAVACAMVLLQAGAEITERVMKKANEESFFAKGVPKARLLRVLNDHKKGIQTKWEDLEDLDKEPQEEEAAPQKEEEPKAAAAAAAVDTEAPPLTMAQMVAQAVEKKLPSRAQLEAMWDYYDEDENGDLSEKELGKLLQEIYNQTSGQAKADLEANKDDPVKRKMHEAINAAIEKNMGKINDPKFVFDLWCKFDTDDDDLLTKDEFLDNAEDVLFRSNLFGPSAKELIEAGVQPAGDDAAAEAVAEDLGKAMEEGFEQLGKSLEALEKADCATQ